MNLSHSCCKNSQSTQIRQRYNPTFVHEPIFIQGSAQVVTARCTPTYHSTALDNQGYNIQTIHHKNQQSKARPETVSNKSVYSNYSHERRIEDLNPKCQVFYTSKDNWYDHTKEQMLGKVKNCTHRGVSRERKHLNLVSDPVFTDFQYGTDVQKILTTKLAQRNPQDAPIEQVIVQASPKKDFQTEVEPTRDENQVKQAGTETIKNQIEAYSTKKDFHRNCIPQQQLEASSRANDKTKRTKTVNKVKLVSSNPTFTLVRGNKIQNHL